MVVVVEEAFLHVTVNYVTGRLDGHEAVEVVLDENAHGFASGIDRPFEMLDAETKVRERRVRVLDLDEELGVKALGAEKRCRA